MVTVIRTGTATPSTSVGSYCHCSTGDGVSPPAKIRHVSPVYPPAARTAGVEGTVILEATLDATGAVSDVEVLRSVPELGGRRARRHDADRQQPVPRGRRPRAQTEDPDQHQEQDCRHLDGQRNQQARHVPPVPRSRRCRSARRRAAPLRVDRRPGAPLSRPRRSARSGRAPARSDASPRRRATRPRPALRTLRRTSRRDAAGRIDGRRGGASPGDRRTATPPPRGARIPSSQGCAVACGPSTSSDHRTAPPGRRWPQPGRAERGCP